LAKDDLARTHKNPYFEGRGGRRGSASLPFKSVPFERAMVVSYIRVSTVTIALSLIIRPQFAAVSDAQVYRSGSPWGTIWGGLCWPQ